MTAKHTVVHVQYSNGVTVLQRIVKASGEHFERQW